MALQDQWEDFLYKHPRLDHALSSIRRWLPPVNFISIHYAYFVIVCLISSAIFWASSAPHGSIRYVDCLFLVVSAMTETGLNTVNLSSMTTWQQTMLFLLIMLGSTIWVSIWTVLARKHVFQRRFDDIVRAQRLERAERAQKSNARESRLSLRALTFRQSKTVPNPEHATLGSQIPTEKTPADVDAELADKQRPNIQRTTSMPLLSRSSPVNRPRDAAASKPEPVAETGTEEDTAKQNDGHIAFLDLPHPRQDENPRTSRVYAANQATDREVEEATERTENGPDLLQFWREGRSGRHSEFHSLTSAQREHLGGCEYRALKLLSIIVPLYFVSWQLLGCLVLGSWINNHMPDVPEANGIRPWWLGIFNGVSAFNNSGMSLLDANMVPFQKAYYVLITMGLMILAGNTAYPIFLRFFLWSFLKVLNLTTRQSIFYDLKVTIEFILKYPRRVYTNLFPSRQTWWLSFMLVCLNCLDWVLFELLNLGNPVVDKIPRGARVLVGLFQALAVRSGGFYVVPISQIAIGVQFLYVIMMYISVYPVVITMRHSNVYEERSLGIYSSDEHGTPDNDDDDATSTHRVMTNRSTAERESVFSRTSATSARPSALVRRISHSRPAADVGHAIRRTFTTFHGVGAHPTKHGSKKRSGTSIASNMKQTQDNRTNFIQQQMHGQLAHDIWWLALAVLVITAIETRHFEKDPIVFSVFNIIFEVVSAYGTVGISVGVPTAAYSFCGEWYTASKLVLCLVMLRGRHRGLPVALDHAVRLPGEHLHREEEQDQEIRRVMSESRTALDGE